MILPASIMKPKVLKSRSTVFESVTMSISTSNDTHCQGPDSTTSIHRSHALVLGEEVESSTAANSDSVAFFDKETKLWKLDDGKKNM